MRNFDYAAVSRELLTPDIVDLLTAVHEYRGRQDLYLEAHADALDVLRETARIQSTGASNRIEGIYTSAERLKEIVEASVRPKNRNEEEIAGYRDVLATIHENYPHIALTPSVLLQLHRDLYRYTSAGFAGTWKDSDNAIVEIDGAGNRVVRFRPPTAVETPIVIEASCAVLREARERNTGDALLQSLPFVFDFVSIHPFNDGNGRMSRLLTLLVLYQSGYLVGSYVSIEKLIEDSKDTYYDALAASSAGWGEGRNDYAPFVRYMLGIMLAAYRMFEQRVGDLAASGKTKAQRIADVFDRRIGKVTKADILAELPDVSATTVERTLGELLKAGAIAKVGAGRTTGYVKR